MGTVPRDMGTQALCGLSEEGREKSHAVREILPAGVSVTCISLRSCGQSRMCGGENWPYALADGGTGPSGRGQGAPASVSRLFTASPSSVHRC